MLMTLPRAPAFARALLLLSLDCPLAALGQGSAVDHASQTIQLALSGEPPNLNYMKASDQVSFFILEQIHEGLVRKNERGELSPGIAERWELRDDGATFWLREEARWSDGEPITAHDFVFAWRNVLDPVTASEYAFILYPIKNAEAVNTGQAPLEALGVRAIDERTLEVELEKPTGYFLSLMSFGLYFPARENFVRQQGSRFGADVRNMVFSGPFKLTEWVHGASLRMEKNEHYWDKESVTLNAIDIPYITPDALARFNLYKDGKLAIENAQIGLPAEQLKSALDNRMRIRSISDGSVFFSEFNHRPDRVTSNRNFRKALQSVFDSQELVYKVIGIPGYIPGASLFPVYLNGVEGKFRQEYPVQPPPISVQKGREYLELARREMGIDRFPPLVILADDTPVGQKQAQYLQSYYNRTLGLEVRIDIQTFKQRLAKMNAGDFDIVLAGWGPDYEDPMTFADLFASWNTNNHGRYQNAEYDRLIRLAQGTADPRVRMDAMGRIQEIVIDDAIVLPGYERVISYVQHPDLDGIVFSITGGSPLLKYARVLE